MATNHLEGDFPGGVADLAYQFTMDGDRIARADDRGLTVTRPSGSPPPPRIDAHPGSTSAPAPRPNGPQDATASGRRPARSTIDSQQSGCDATRAAQAADDIDRDPHPLHGRFLPTPDTDRTLTTMNH